MAKIEMISGKLQVPNQPDIPYITGDGVGVDISPAMIKVVDTAVAKAYGSEKTISWHELAAGEKAYAAQGDYLPQETVTALTENLVAIKGPLMTPIGEGFRSLNVTLRQQFDLFANVRPITYFKGVASPVKRPENVEMTIFRENTEDIYAGIEFESESPDAERLIKLLKTEFGIDNIRFEQTSAIGIKPVSPDGTKRLVRAAFDHAVANGKRSASDGASSSGRTGTTDCSTIGPWSSVAVTKCTVAPATLHPASIARRCVCSPGNSGSSDGWMFSS